MRKFVLSVLILMLTLVCDTSLLAQGFSFSCTQDTTINTCNNSQCISIQALIPDLRSRTTTYNAIRLPAPGGCFPVYANPNDPSGVPASLTIDDRYSNVIPLGFNFPFYDSTYINLVASTNGLVSFDASRATGFSHYAILNSGGSLTASGTSPAQDLPSGLYDRALIMGPYHDLNPALTASSPNLRIQHMIVGTAPHRRWILSFFKVPLFNCNTLIENTHQIIIYESTGIIEVKIFSKEICNTWNQGRAMIGIQNWDRTQAVMVPGRRASDAPWGGVNMNETYRFIPSSGTSLLKRVELYDMAGALISTGTTSPATVGSLNASFPSVCPPMGASTYIVKSVYQKIDDAAVEIFGTDTIRVNRTPGNSLNATATTTPSACGPNGTITATVPTGMGTAPYTFTLGSGTPQTGTSNTHTFNGLTSGAYTVTVTDAGGCTSSIAANVISSGVLTVNSAVTRPSCAGAPNGSVTLSPQNGVAPHQYTMGTTTQASPTFNNLPAGTYVFTIRDASGCVLNNYQVVVPQGPALIASPSVNPPSCSGAANGSITINPPANGQAPFTFQLNSNGFQGSNTFSNLPSGSYFVSVRDAQGCALNNMFVSVPTGTGTLNVTVTSTNTSCAGANNGTITLTPTSGSGPYQHSINGGALQPGNVITNLAPGTYSVVLRDGAGCSSNPQSVTITQGSALLATTSAVSASCTGVNNGRIIVTPTNGAGPYQYTIDGGAPQTDSIFQNVAAGNHTITVRDGAGCVTTPIAVSVGTAAAVTGTVAASATSCNGAANGSLTLTPANGVAPYQYSLNSGGYQPGATFSNLASGNYTITIRDNVGCVSSAITATIDPGAALTGTVVSAATSCNGATDGTITATPTNGNPVYSYSLDNGSYQGSATFTGVAPGNHSVVIRDGAGCMSAAIPVVVAAGSTMTATITPVATSCSGAPNGRITVTNVSGNGPFQYSIDGTNFQASNTFTGLAAGPYTVTFRNSIGCIASGQVTVVPGPAVTATVTTTPVSCFNGNNGGATVTLSANGTTPYQFSLDGVTYQASNTFTGLAAGTYTVYFRDAASCSGTQAFTITQPTTLGATFTTQAVSCNGLSDGRFTITPSGGTAPYQYSINGTTYQASNTFSLAAGTYPIFVRDANGCIFQVSAGATMSEPARLTVSAVPANAGCTGNDGTITITANGGVSNYTYTLNTGAYQSSNVFTLNPGTYTATVRDGNGCTATTGSLVVGLSNTLTVTPASDETICEGTSVKLQPVTNGTQFYWTPTTNLVGSTNREPVVSPTVTTDYIAQITLGICVDYDTIRVNVRPAPVPNAGQDATICFGKDYQLSGSGGVSFQWSPSTYLDNTTTATPISLKPGQTIRYNLHVTDINNCQSLVPGVVTINVTPPIQVFTNPPDTVAYIGDTIRLLATSIGTSYQWSPATGLNDPAIANPMLTVSSDQIYTVEASTAAGCKGSTSFKVRAYQGPEIYVPNAFTPNGDAKNDYLRPIAVGIKSLHYFKVYNRWGQEVYSWTGNSRGNAVYDLRSRSDIGWNGKINGISQDTQTYVWVAEGVTSEGKVVQRKGTTTLIR